MNKAKEIIIDELNEQGHVEPVEDVIFWALEFYAKHHKDTRGGVVSYSIVERIKEEETKQTND